MPTPSAGKRYLPSGMGVALGGFRLFPSYSWSRPKGKRFASQSTGVLPADFSQPFAEDKELRTAVSRSPPKEACPYPSQKTRNALRACSHVDEGLWLGAWGGGHGAEGSRPLSLRLALTTRRSAWKQPLYDENVAVHSYSHTDVEMSRAHLP